VPVVPTHAEPGRLWSKHFLYYSGTGRLADVLGLDDDVVTDLSLHRVLLQALADSPALSLHLELD
jgi:hypothetical protein